MISTDTASLALSIANGLIKFGGRLDKLLAEQTATRSGLTLTLPAVNFSPGPNVVLPKLQAYLAGTTAADPGPIGAQRVPLAALLVSGYQYQPADLAALRQYYALAFPEEAVVAAVSPDANFLAYLRDAMPEARACLPEDANDTDPTKQANLQAALLASAFYVAPGADARQLGYPVRIGLLVVDVLAEFGADNTQLFVRDPGLRAAVQAVLTNFSQPDLESFDAWSPLLKHTLSATLNGVLDSRASWQGNNPWLGATLGALADARAAAGANGDNYLLGLLQGQGYPLLISKGLSQAAGVLGASDAPAFQQIVADMLNAAAPLVQGSPSFASFFNAHWPDLVQAGLVSVQQHGPALVQGQSPVLRDVLLATMNVLANTPAANLLDSDTVFGIANAAIGAVAEHPEIWNGAGNNPWLGQLVSSVLSTVSSQGVQTTFTTGGLAAIMKSAMTTVAAHPEWIVKDPGLLQAVVGGTLTQLSGLNTLTATTIANAAVSGALNAIAARPDLIGGSYPQVVASFAGLLGQQVTAGSLTNLQAADIAEAAAGAVLANPQLFANATTGLAGVITKAVIAAAGADQAKLVAGTTLVALVQQLFATMARNGATVAAPDAIGQLQAKLTQVLGAGLTAAETQLGNGLDLPALPTALASLVSAWASGQVATIDPNDPAFKALFAQIAAKASAGGPLAA